jgi:hypothetical protein
MDEREQPAGADEGTPNQGATGDVRPEEAAEDAAAGAEGAAQDAAVAGEPNQGAAGGEAPGE